MTEPVSSRTVAERLDAAFGADDLETVMGLLDPEVDWELVGPPEIPCFGRYRGLAEVRRFFEILGERCVVDALDPQRLTETAEGVVVEGSERGSFRGRPAPYQMRWCHLTSVRDGRVVRFVDHMDTAPMLAAWRS
jgi:ketosteroid isomerase-like protein